MAADTISSVSKSNASLTSKLYDIISRGGGNIIFSPISLHAVLSLAYQGTAGETENAFRNVLDIPLAKSAAEGYKEIMSTLNNVDDVALHIANKVFVMENYTLKDTFKAVASQYFLSEAENVNFIQNKAAAKIINDWVEGKTNNKIKDLILPDDLNELTRLVLVNAIYFKGDWLLKFDPAQTRVEPFYISETETVDCQMMHIKKKFDFAVNSDLDAKILKLPYKNKNVSMVVILPNKRTGIKELEKKLLTRNLSTLTSYMRNVEVEVSLPKFKIEATIELNDPLKEVSIFLHFCCIACNFYVCPRLFTTCRVCLQMIEINVKL